MKKKTIIIISSVIFTLLLLVICFQRAHLLLTDHSGFYNLNESDVLIKIYTFLPEISVLLTIASIYVRRGWGMFLTGIACFLTLASFFGELLIKMIRIHDIISPEAVPHACVPWLNIPVLVIGLILFFVKYEIFMIPDEVSFKRKKVRVF